MIPRRRATAPPAPEVPVFEFDVVDVIRLHMMLDTGLPLEFDMETNDKLTGDSYSINENFSQVRVGKRIINIATKRILYYEVFPTQIKRPRKPITAEQLASLQQ